MRFYSPKNFKKGRHVGGMFRWIDIAVLGVGSLIFIPMMIILLMGDSVNIPLLLIVALLYGIVVLLIQSFYTLHCRRNIYGELS